MAKEKLKMRVKKSRNQQTNLRENIVNEVLPMKNMKGRKRTIEEASKEVNKLEEQVKRTKEIIFGN